MFFFYQLIVSVVFVLSPIFIIVRILKNKEDPKRFKEKFSLPTKKRVKGNLIWFHGASIGEIQSIIPIIRNYEENKSVNQILVTSSTLSSSKVLKKYKLKKTIHQFYPIDLFFFTKKFLKFWKPNICIFIDSEIWPCMYNNINKKKIPLILLNARLTKKSINRWDMIENFTKSIFKNITIAFPQNNETYNFLKKINITRVNLIGNLKFSESNEDSEIKNNLKSIFKNRKVWVASSTHKNEEIFCARSHLELKKKFKKKIITIIIPRHIHRVKEIISELERLNLRVVCHSDKIKKLDNIDIYLVDTFGETKIFHKIASSVFLGGSIIKRGGQNPLEAARYGARILHGPNIDNFKDVYYLLSKHKISKKIYNSKQMASLIIFKKNNITGNKIKNIGEKILKKTINELDIFINNEFKKT